MVVRSVLIALGLFDFHRFLLEDCLYVLIFDELVDDLFGLLVLSLSDKRKWTLGDVVYQEENGLNKKRDGCCCHHYSVKYEGFDSYFSQNQSYGV